jgi:hypothetical protein
MASDSSKPVANTLGYTVTYYVVGGAALGLAGALLQTNGVVPDQIFKVLLVLIILTYLLTYGLYKCFSKLTVLCHSNTSRQGVLENHWKGGLVGGISSENLQRWISSLVISCSLVVLLLVVMNITSRRDHPTIYDGQAKGNAIALGPVPASSQSQSGPISGPAYQLIDARVAANQAGLYVYLDQDSGFNHGFPSGFFASNAGNLGTIHIDTGCVFDATAANGCSADSSVLDRSHGTVLRISFDSQTSGNFAGVNIEEPENWGVLQTGSGYDLRGASSVTFDAWSPNNAMVQFGVGRCVTSFMPVSQNWTTISFSLTSLAPAPGATTTCPPTLDSVHVLFTVVTNDTHAPNGATVLLDNIQFSPVPNSRQSALGFPLGNQTFGVLPQQNTPFPPDQVLRNLTTIYESSLTELALLARSSSTDVTNAKLIADTFDYALHHDSHGDPIPVAADGSVGLHNGYENGDIALFNNQQPPKQGQAGDIRLAGFTATTLCAPSNYCLVLDGATGGNNAFAILALVAAYEQFGDTRYLNDAVMIGNWIAGNLTDTTGTGYGGYFLGYPDLGVPPPKPLQTGKSIENNADIFAAFTALAAVEAQLGNSTAAAQWPAAANVAGDFVMRMFDSTNGRFNVGTVPVGTAPAPGICPTGAQQGNEVINVCDFLDSNTFTTLALAASPRYQNQIDWRRPIQYAVNNFAQTVTAGGVTFQGFDIVPSPVSGPNGAAWEFTGQAVEAMRFVDRLYSDTRFEASANFYVSQIAQAQTSAPFGDGLGLVAATVQSGDTLPPSQQCVQTPFQCITERVGLAATIWAILAEQKLNVFSPFPAASLSTTTVAFSGQPVTTTSATQTVTVTNTGAVALSISGITANNDFAVASAATTCSTTSELSAGGSCVIAVTFAPTATGLRTGTLTISLGAQASPVAVAISGIGSDFQVVPQSGAMTSMTVTAGQPAANFMLQANPLPSPPISGTSFTGPITITCAITGPTRGVQPSCGSVSPNVANPDGNPVTFTLAVSTTGRTSAAVSTGEADPRPRVWTPIAILVGFVFLVLSKARGRTRWAIGTAAMTTLLCAFLISCGSNGGGGGGGAGGGTCGTGTCAGSYTITVTGTVSVGSTRIQHTLTPVLTLTVN